MARKSTYFDERGRAVPANSSYARRLDELKTAFREIGDTSTERLAWMVRFVNKDRTLWTSADRAALGDCLLALSGFAYPNNFLGGVSLPPPLPPSDVDEAHHALRDMLTNAVKHAPGIAEVPTDAVQIALVRATAPGRKPVLWGSAYRYQNALAVLHVCRNLVLEVGERLTACQWCGAPILAERKRLYCNEQCGQRSRNERKNPR